MVLLLLLAFVPFASTRDGVYTDRQASRGQEAYQTACASCHGENLEGSGAVSPALAGPDFLAGWTGQTLGDFFDKIQTTMPIVPASFRAPILPISWLTS